MKNTITVMGKEIPYYVRDIPLKDLTVSEDLPSFKSEADLESGVVEGLRLEGRFETFGTGPVAVWERIDGSMSIISGRHRDDLAKRTEGVDKLHSHVVKEEDGFTTEMAIFIDAELNIRDGQGTIRDIVYFIRYSDIPDEELTSRGWFSRPAATDAWHLGRRACDDLYILYRNGRIKENQAVEIAKAAGDDHELQGVAINHVIRHNPAPDGIRQFIAAYKEIFGGVSTPTTGDLFGKSDAALKEAEQMVQVAQRLKRRLKDKLAVAQSVERRPEAAEDMGISINDVEYLNRRIREVYMELEGWNSWETDHEKIEILRREINPDYGVARMEVAVVAEAASTADGISNDETPGDDESVETDLRLVLPPLTVI